MGAQGSQAQAQIADHGCPRLLIVLLQGGMSRSLGQPLTSSCAAPASRVFATSSITSPVSSSTAGLQYEGNVSPSSTNLRSDLPPTFSCAAPVSRPDKLPESRISATNGIVNPFSSSVQHGSRVSPGSTNLRSEFPPTFSSANAVSRVNLPSTSGIIATNTIQPPLDSPRPIVSSGRYVSSPLPCSTNLTTQRSPLSSLRVRPGGRVAGHCCGSQARTVPPSGETSSQWDGHYDLLTCFPWDEDTQHEFGAGRMEEGFWFRAGTPAIRVEPHWKDSQWYITAPVDLKGIRHLPQEQREDFLYSTDYHVASMDDAGKLPALAHPHHEGKSCPIS